MEQQELGPRVSKLAKLKFPIRIIQAVLAVIILGLTAYAMSVLKFLAPGTYGLNIFTCIVTFLAVTYSLVFPKFVPKFHNLFAEAGLEVLLLIFWFSAFISMAVFAGTWSYYSYGLKTKRSPTPKGGKSGSSSGSSSSSYNDDYNGIVDSWRAALNCSKAVAGLGALMFLFTGIIFIYLIILAIRQWKIGKDGATPEVAAMQNVEAKAPADYSQQGYYPPQQPTPAPEYQQPQYAQQQYAQQPAPGQQFTSPVSPEQQQYQNQQYYNQPPAQQPHA